MLGCNLSLLTFFEELMVFQEVPGVNNKVICNFCLPGKEFPGIVKLW